VLSSRANSSVRLESRDPEEHLKACPVGSLDCARDDSIPYDVVIGRPANILVPH
jgi:hypothetical protein